MKIGKEELWSWTGIISSCVNTQAHSTHTHTHTGTHVHFLTLPSEKVLETTPQLQRALLMPTSWLLNTI